MQRKQFTALLALANHVEGNTLDQDVVVATQGFRIGAVVVEPDLNRLVCGDDTASVEPRIMNVLCSLASKPGRVCSRDDLITDVWGVQFGGDESLSRAISILRKAIKGFGQNDIYIETIAKRGYRLVQSVEGNAAPAEAVTDSTSSVSAALGYDLRELPSIAVLPFENQSDESGHDYFIDGLMEEVVSGLTRIRTLFVIASGSSLALKGENIGSLEAASKLGVRYAVEGRVRRSGDRVRIWVQLIDAIDGRRVWHDKFDGALNEVFDLYDEVALGVAGVVEFSVQTQETLRANNHPTSDLRAYELYLRGLSRLRSYSKKGMYEALDLLHQALERDPNYALAHSLVASCHANIAQAGWSDDPLKDGQMIEHHIEASLINGPDDPQVVATASLACRVGGDHLAAKRLAEQAYALNSGSSFTQMVLGAAQVTDGNFDEAERLLNLSIRLDPYSPNRTLQVGFLAALQFARQDFDQAAVLANEGIRYSHSPPISGLLISALGHLGERKKAKEIMASLNERAMIDMDSAAATFFLEPSDIQLFHDGIAKVQA